MTLYVRVHVHACTCIRVYSSECVRVCVCACVYLSVFKHCQVCSCVCTCMCECVCECECECESACVHNPTIDFLVLSAQSQVIGNKLTPQSECSNKHTHTLSTHLLTNLCDVNMNPSKIHPPPPPLEINLDTMLDQGFLLEAYKFCTHQVHVFIGHY